MCRLLGNMDLPNSPITARPESYWQNRPVKDPIEMARDNVRKVHEQFAADLRSGDTKAMGMFGMLAGEMNAARESLDLPPLTTKEDEDGHEDGI